MTQSYLEKARQVLRIESEAISKLESRIDDNFVRAIEAIYRIRGKVIVTGVGKSGHVGKRIAATLSSTGTPSFFIHAGEANHGDLGGISGDDIVIMVSNSGETNELINLLPALKQRDVPIIGLIGKSNSLIAKKCDIVISTQVDNEACPMGIIPTASTIVTSAMGDALAIALVDKRGFKEQDFAGLHPGGSLGRRLLTTVADLMHSGDEVPLVNETCDMKKVLFEMTQKGLGVVGILNEKETLVGVISDGDLRRGLEKIDDFLQRSARDVMSSNPKAIQVASLAIDALRVMEDFAITSIFVFKEQNIGRPDGIIHIHDILRYGIMS